jgi:hypothetical protein
MKMLETTLSIGRTINLGNYESLRVDLSIKAEIDSDEYSGALKSLEEVISKNLDSVINRQLNKPVKNKNTEEFV